MRRYGIHALVIFSMSGITGCSWLPSFPDLWPFNDQPAAQAGPSQLPPVTSEAEAELAAVVPSAVVEPPAQPRPEPLPLTQTAQLVPPPSPVLNDVGGITPSAPGAVAYIISPVDGAVVTNPVRVLFGLDRMGIAPATLEQEEIGHHHVLINTDLPSLDRPIPVDQNHRHFSGGQTETTLNLPVGQNTLQLLLGDHSHTPHRPPVVSRKITITVQ